jgi:hypothetical protein
MSSKLTNKFEKQRLCWLKNPSFDPQGHPPLLNALAGQAACPVGLGRKSGR